VIAHQAPSPNSPEKSTTHPPEVLNEDLPIFVIMEDVTPSIASRHHVIQRALEFNTKWSCHLQSIPSLHQNANVKT